MSNEILWKIVNFFNGATEQENLPRLEALERSADMQRCHAVPMDWIWDYDQSANKWGWCHPNGSWDI